MARVFVRVRVTVTTAWSEGAPEPSSLSRALSRNVVSGESQYCRSTWIETAQPARPCV